MEPLVQPTQANGYYIALVILALYLINLAVLSAQASCPYGEIPSRI